MCVCRDWSMDVALKMPECVCVHVCTCVYVCAWREERCG